jgi:hypothetical protein
LHKLIAKRKNFKQLEDFNTEADEEDEEYQKEYHARLSGKKSGASPPSTQPGADEPKGFAKGQEPRLVGCYARESELGKDKEYVGGNSGAYIALARQAAWEKGKKYIAIAKNVVDGHSFVFNEPPTGKSSNDKGCRQPCLDTNVAGYACGCADSGCEGVKAPKGEDNVRRWVVYEIPEKKSKKSKKSKKGKKGKKAKKAASDDEL